MQVTLVTAFFRLSDRAVDEDEQFRLFDRLAMCGLPIILFLDERLMDRAPKRANVRVVPKTLESLWLFEQAQGRELELPKNRNPEKDTRDFLLLQNSKLDLLRSAMMLDLDSSHFAWIDFGIMKIVRDPMVFWKRLRTLSPSPQCVLAPGCWSRDQSTNDQSVNWRFCGGFLLADRGSVRALAMANEIIFTEPTTLTWEVNVWAAMERAGRKFDWYKADHDDSILPHVGEPRVCLCMIVKNEGAIIERCLAAALPFIDTWCILDTGSTDGTPVLIGNFFMAHAVPGRLEYGEFKNFAQARNDALTAARGLEGWDYALLIDADMVVTGELTKSALTAPAYSLKQHNGSLDYSNTRLVRRDAPAMYLGVTHEYLSVEGVRPLAGLTIDDRNDGGSKSDKGERDIRLLLQGLTDEPNNERYMFYLAQTYRETGRHTEAIHWYKSRIARGGWDEEIWASHYGIAHAYKELGDTPHFIEACLEAYNYRSSRGESLKLLARFYRERGKHEAALLIAEGLAQIPYPGDHLFVEHEVYDFGAQQEIAIAGYYSTAFRDDGYVACAALTIHPNGGVREEARKNFTFYAKSARELFGAETREIDWKPSDGWAPMNPSVCVDGDRRLVLVRTVNYTVADGQYPTIDNSGIIRTKNYVLEMHDDWRSGEAALIKDITETPRSSFPVEGFEDCRLWRVPTRDAAKDSGFRISTTVRDLADSDGRCEMAIVDLDHQWRATNIQPIRDYEYDKTQKNWMPITGCPGSFLYLCDPTIVIDSTGLSPTVEQFRHAAPACLVDLRGGSQLIEHGTGWLCITHEVAWRPERVYLHRFVRFDHEFKIIAVSDPFFFERVGIEFCAGLARDGDKLVASFGVNDASAHLAFFDPDMVDKSLKYPS